MRKGAIVIMMGVLAAAGAWATDLNPEDAWVGGVNANPTTYTPQQLISSGYELNGTQRGKIESDNNDWYQWDEPYDYDYDWLLCKYDDPDPDGAISNWEVAIDHDTNSVHLYYWNSTNEEWDYVESNAGGRTPGTETSNVTDAFVYDTGDDPHALLLFVGYTPAANDDWIKCDVADIDYR